MAIEDEWALVLSGGGVKGSYEIGVWQSLISSGMDKLITGVSGTSVGSLNGAMFVLGDYQKACDIWLSLSQEDIFSIDFKKGIKYLTENDHDFFKLSKKEKKRDVIKKLIEDVQSLEVKRIFDVIKKGTLKKIIEENIDSEALRSKNIKFFATCSALYSEDFDSDKIVILEGLKYIFNNVSSFNDSELQKCCINALKGKSRPVYFDTNETRFEISDILMASAAFPIALEKITINDITYIDGGVHDNTPVKPLYEIGYRKFICVYLDTEQQVNKDDFKDAQIIEIRPSDDEFDKLKRVVIVNKKVIEEQIMAGFIDSMRALKLNGLWK